MTSFSYDKAPPTIALVATRDVPYFVGKPPTTGEATLRATVTYKGILISDRTFTNLGDGVHQIKVIYSPRSEERGTPYVVTLTLTDKGQTVSTSVNIFP